MTTRSRSFLSLTIALLGAAAGAQEPPLPQLTRQTAIDEFRALVTRQTKSFAEQKERDEALKVWLIRSEGIDLGEWSFARAIASYFARDLTAPQQLLDYWRQFQKLPTKDFDTIAGRMFMLHAVTSIRSGDLDAATETSKLAFELYADSVMVYTAIGRALLEAKGDQAKAEKAQAMLADLEKRLDADARLTAEKKQQARDRMKPVAQGGAPKNPPSIEPFEAVDLDGKRLALADYRGKVVLVDFWATWCGPCLREMPNVVAAYEKYHGQGFEIVGVSLDKESAADKIREVMKQHGMTWRQIYDGKYWDSALAASNKIRSIPATYLFDRSGKCREANLRGEALGRAIEKLLAEPAPAGADKPVEPGKSGK